jgi:toxin ParE1/3/4
MALRVVFRHLAQADIDAAAELIARDSPRKALQWAESIRRKCLTLARHPERAQRFSGDVRRLVAGQYLVFYRIADPDDPVLRRVIVLRVLHGRMDVERLVDGDD